MDTVQYQYELIYYFSYHEQRDNHFTYSVFVLYRDSLVVQFLVSPEIISVLPDESVRLGELISVVPVVFTQGVNEKQTLANIKHE